MAAVRLAGHWQRAVNTVTSGPGRGPVTQARPWLPHHHDDGTSLTRRRSHGSLGVSLRVSLSAPVPPGPTHGRSGRGRLRDTTAVTVTASPSESRDECAEFGRHRPRRRTLRVTRTRSGTASGPGRRRGGPGGGCPQRPANHPGRARARGGALWQSLRSAAQFSA
jgi:hypothetical protein